MTTGRVERRATLDLTEATRIFVVDDDTDSREATAAFLRGVGYHVDEFETAEDALPFVGSASVILTDITMPTMSGYEFARAVRADERARGAVILALSGRSDVSPEQAALFDGVIQKPFEPDAIVDAIERASERRDVRPVGPSGPAAPDAPRRAQASGEPGIDGRDGAARLSDAEYRLLVDHSPTMVKRAGLDGGCDYVNETWLAFTGRNAEDEIGDGWLSSVHPDDASSSRETYRRSFEQRAAFDLEYRLRRHDGVYRTVFDRTIPLFDHAGRFCGLIGSAIDVNERAEADRAKATFLAMMAHEMRTPLTPLLAYRTQMSRAHASGGTVSRDLVTRMGRQIDRLAALVEHLGDAARLSTRRRLTVHEAPEDLGTVVKRVAERMCESLEARRDSKHTPKLVVTGTDEACPVLGDRSRLEQLTRALVDNAVKFSPRGGTVHVSLATESGQQVLRVQDEGIGIPPEELSAVGRPYFRASNAPADNYPGLGLGLSVAREIAEVHGGSLTVETGRSGRGVRVTVRLLARTEVAA